jgi:hypothetical protein
MIIATEDPFIIGGKYLGKVTDIQLEWTIVSFIVLREATLDEMLNQLDELNYPRENFHPEPNYSYYKVQVD